jgi:hypothetical protein
MKELMLADTPMEQREQILRDSCDQIVERSYTRKFSGAELAQKRTEYCDVAERVGGLTQELAEVTADIKGKIKPLKERMGGLLDEIKARGEFVRGDCFKFVDQDEGKVGFYDTNGYLVEERDMTPEERQRTVFQAIRKTGTDD